MVFFGGSSPISSSSSCLSTTVPSFSPEAVSVNPFGIKKISTGFLFLLEPSFFLGLLLLPLSLLFLVFYLNFLQQRLEKRPEKRSKAVRIINVIPVPPPCIGKWDNL
jgi:hypothetical protein